ncbi:SWIM zinc finger family protein [Rhodopirellula sp. JC639]|uniref:SWIM zinc finger family protein n=1 Tax=Stieleria mannarensis TaxID=2755585 RepID=UPI001C717C39|nr:SWIM zinc finger family protein [Rhodopirellula sp. JC639]
MKPSKWPALTRHGDLVWGECQGSGANPYRTVFDNSNAGYKCTCPSRKYPCKHVLALMWMYVEDPAPFADGETPQWVNDWSGRRRNTSGSARGKSDEKSVSKAGKSLAVAQQAEQNKPLDPKAEARRKAAAEKRAKATRKSIAAGIDELQQWTEDQVRGGLAAFLSDPNARCRTIAARLVDAKAQAMASRLDELPSRLMQVSGDRRLDLLIQELGRIVLICRAWKANQEDAELTRLVGSSETRDSILELQHATRVAAIWEVVGEQVTTRRDGLVSQATWLMNLGDGLRFALLLDFFPASLGNRSSTFAVGERFEAELAFYPARHPVRAVIAERKSGDPSRAVDEMSWPVTTTPPLDSYRETLGRAPWMDTVPMLLPGGRIAQADSSYWWRSDDGGIALPIGGRPAKHIAGVAMQQTAALWDGMILTLLSSQSEWGSLSYGE